MDVVRVIDTAPPPLALVADHPREAIGEKPPTRCVSFWIFFRSGVSGGKRKENAKKKKKKKKKKRSRGWDPNFWNCLNR
jgi:hypothetical protein